MGQTFVDQYSTLHLLSGVLARAAGLDFYSWFMAHLAFEVTENTDTGIKFINENFTWWPGGGKEEPDANINVIGDQISALVGWWIHKQLAK